MNRTDSAPVDSLVPPLLRALDVLQAIARHLDPSILASLVQAIDAPESALLAAREGTTSARLHATDADRAIAAACDAALTAMRDLRAAGLAEDLRAAYRALRQVASAQEALYPLCPLSAVVSDHFLARPVREEPTSLERACVSAQDDRTGVLHFANERSARGGFSIYVPEYYRPQQAWPLVVALHGGSGHGRDFLWNWLRDARGQGAILVAPTASGRTWPIQDEDVDTPKLLEMLDFVRARWSIDPTRVLLTGMSDGGTFAYLTGLQTESPFTHLAPVSAAFHPILAEVAEPARLRGLPVFVAHGALDWMFPVAMAREAAATLAAAGASVTYRELPDLGHCYPVELNAEILGWLRGGTSDRQTIA